jgi:hypothetical protein
MDFRYGLAKLHQEMQADGNEPILVRAAVEHSRNFTRAPIDSIAGSLPNGIAKV